MDPFSSVPNSTDAHAKEIANLKMFIGGYSAYILCGGKSSRMGEEKGLVVFQGKSFVHWILEALIPLVQHVALITKNLAYGIFELELVPDLIDDKGPVGGIYTALNHANSDLVLVLSCDIPKITTDVLSLLLNESVKCPDKITFLSDGKNDYPLIGVYPKSCLSFFQSAILKEELKLRLLVENLPHQRILINSVSVAALRNINTKTELVSLSQTS